MFGSSRCIGSSILVLAKGHLGASCVLKGAGLSLTHCVDIHGTHCGHKQIDRSWVRAQAAVLGTFHLVCPFCLNLLVVEKRVLPFDPLSFRGVPMCRNLSSQCVEGRPLCKAGRQADTHNPVPQSCSQVIYSKQLHSEVC